MKVVWSPLAIERAAEIAELIAADRPSAAEKWLDALFGATERLGVFPESGRVVPELQRSDLREVIHKDYRIIYRIDSEAVSMMTVRHSRQLTTVSDLPNRA